MKLSASKLAWWGCSVLLLIGPINRACSQPFVAITVPAGGLGDTSALEPFALDDLQLQSIRYQQVYRASDFLRDLPNGGTITEMAFGVDGRGFTAGIREIQINMALTSRGPDQLSATFSENIGVNLQSVYADEPLLFGAALGATAPIRFTQPYFYNPAEGNLLLEILIFSPVGGVPDPRLHPGPLDAANNPFGPDAVSRVYAYDVNATVGVADSIGLVTFFRANPVPEPGTWTLLLVGAGLLTLMRTIKRSGRASKS